MKDHSKVKLTRRNFLRGAAASLAAANLFSSYSWFRPSKAFGATEPELIIAEKGTPTQLLKAAMGSFGGMSRVVKKGQRVVIKANIAWAEHRSRPAPTIRNSSTP